MSHVAVFVTTFIVVLIVFVGFDLWRRRKHKQRFESVRMLTAPSDVDGFISETDGDIEKTNNAAHVRFLQINKSTGLFYGGKWTAAIALLESIDPSTMPRDFRALYYNNLMASKLLLGEIDAANQLYARHVASLAQFITHHDLNVALNITIGALEYYNGEIPKSKMLFEYALCLAQMPLHKAATHYFLALVAASEDNHPKAIEHFNQAMVAGTDTWISEFARNHATALESLEKVQGC